MDDEKAFIRFSLKTDLVAMGIPQEQVDTLSDEDREKSLPIDEKSTRRLLFR